MMKKYKKISADLELCIELLEQKPFSGTHLGKGLYKLRLKSSDKSRGKSGGFRIIYYLISEEKKIYLLTIYSKSEIENIPEEKLIKILEEIKEL